MIQPNKIISVKYVPWYSAVFKLRLNSIYYFSEDDMRADTNNIRQELTNNYTTDMGGIFHIELEE